MIQLIRISWPEIRYVELDIKNLFLHFILLGYKINFNQKIPIIWSNKSKLLSP
jgi:hypothetical protein